MNRTLLSPVMLKEIVMSMPKTRRTMRLLSTVAVMTALFLLLAPHGRSDEDPTKKRLEEIQGTWILTGLEADGKEALPAKLEGTTLVIKGDIYTVKTKSATHQVRLKLDAAKSPWHMDMTFLDGANKDKTLEGIYELNKGALRIARGLLPEQARPEQFATWPNTNYFVMTWTKKD